MKRIHDICAMKEKLTQWAQDAMFNGMESIDTSELGLVIDMIKDLYEAELYCAESLYYATVTEAMNQNDVPYDKHTFWMNRAGMRHPPDRKMYWDNSNYYDGRMGYSSVSGPRSEIGRNWDHYVDARRHYQATKSDSDRMDMSASAQMHMGETIATLREMWRDADPDLRQKMKKDFGALLQEMN